MKILHLTDIHGKKSSIDKIADDLEIADIILISGDITHFGRGTETNEIINELKKFNKSIFAVPGNCDYPEVNQVLEEQNISLDKHFVETDGFTIMGMGGSLPCPGTTPNEYPEEIYKLVLNSLFDKIANISNNLILLIHQPPKKTKNDRVKIGLHVGSKEVRKFIEEKQPLLVLSGHIHEGRGVDEIGTTKIVNPGSFREGNYGIIEINEGEVLVNLKRVN